jgi:hypothetical protein
VAAAAIAASDGDARAYDFSIVVAPAFRNAGIEAVTGGEFLGLTIALRIGMNGSAFV